MDAEGKLRIGHLSYQSSWKSKVQIMGAPRSKEVSFNDDIPCSWVHVYGRVLLLSEQLHLQSIAECAFMRASPKHRHLEVL